MLKILYAEDNIGMRKMVSHFLNIAGLDITSTTDGDEAIEEAKLQEFDVILLDVTMERIDGLEAALTIRKLNNCNSKKPIIGLTGRTEDSEIMQCHASGMDLVLAKPVDLEELVKVLTEVTYIGTHEFIDLEKPQHKLENKSIDLDVLVNYRKIAGPQALEGILRDFSDIWPRKIGELFSCIICNNNDGFARAGEELCTIAAGIGAGKVAHFASQAVSAFHIEDRQNILPQLVEACSEVQEIVNGLSDISNKAA